MRSLIFGIIAVFCLQLSFQLYMGVERTDAEYARMPPVIGFHPGVQQIADIPDVGYEVESAGLRPSALRPHVVRYVENKRTRALPLIARHPVQHPFVPTTTVIVARSFQPPVITRRTEHPGTTAPTAVKTKYTDVAERRPEQRNLIAKALPVIKKPWDWMKSVGSLFR